MKYGAGISDGHIEQWREERDWEETPVIANSFKKETKGIEQEGTLFPTNGIERNTYPRAKEWKLILTLWHAQTKNRLKTKAYDWN